MMGQLCPPSLLVAISVLEALFFRRHGCAASRSATPSRPTRRRTSEAVRALRRLAAELLPDVDWHVVIYTYMGVFPRTPGGRRGLLEEAARLAVRSGAARLIVKTVGRGAPHPDDRGERRRAGGRRGGRRGRARLPGRRPRSTTPASTPRPGRSSTRCSTSTPTSDAALVRAVRRGYLDVPYCLHPDNAGRTRSVHRRRRPAALDAPSASLPIGPPGRGTPAAHRDLGRPAQRPVLRGAQVRRRGARATRTVGSSPTAWKPTRRHSGEHHD